MHRTDASISIAESDSIHVRLRRATAVHHRRIDCGLAYVLSDSLSTDRYVDLLAALFGFYAPLEDVLSRWDGARPPLGLPLIWRTDLLLRDLRALGRTPEHIPTCAQIPTLVTRERIAGAIYVVEGACLGGQVIARGLMRRLGIGRDNGAAFFTGDGAHTAARWKQVVAWLEERGRGPAGRDEIVAGACQTFAALSLWLVAREVLDE